MRPRLSVARLLLVLWQAAIPFVVAQALSIRPTRPDQVRPITSTVSYLHQGAIPGSSNARMLVAVANSSCSGQGGQEPVLLVSDHCGAMPIAKHVSHAFMQQAAINRVQVISQDFASPSDLTPLTARYPAYDYAIIEQKGSRVGKAVLQPAPSWLGGGSQLVSDTAVLDAQRVLANQTADLTTAQPVVLLYRRDLLDARRLPVPETWDQLLQVAAQVNGTDMNQDGTPDYALCVDADPGCKLYWVFSAVAASMLQANGTASGYLQDPVTGEYLVGSQGMMAALRLWARLLQYNSPEQATKKYCGVWEDTFAEGRCAFTLGMRQLDSHNSLLSGATAKPYSLGRTGQAPTPGSTSVYDRASGTMVNCTPMVCPYATPVTTTATAGGASRKLWEQAASGLQYVNRAPVVVNIGGARQDTRGDNPGTAALRASSDAWAADSQAWVYTAFSPAPLSVAANQAAFAAGSVNFSVLNSNALNMSYYNSSQFLADVYNWADSLRNRTSWTAPSSGGASSAPWLGAADLAGLQQLEAAEYLSLSLWSLTHPNSAPDPQMVAPLRLLVAAAASQVGQGVSEALIGQDIAYRLGLWREVASSSSQWSQELYDGDMGYTGPVWYSQLNNQSASTSDGPRGMSTATLAVAIALPLFTFLMALKVVVYYGMFRHARSGIDIFGKVRPPAVGPATSLLVTDIQNSTHLWEVLPAAVMERCVQLHHAVLRDKLKQYKGYETCTEGDSFIIAFHDPKDALGYCMAVQTALLSVAWPQELLECERAEQDAGELQLEYTPEAMAWCEGKSAFPSLLTASSKTGASRTLARSSFSRAWQGMWPTSPSHSSHSRMARSSSGGLSTPSFFLANALSTSTSPGGSHRLSLSNNGTYSIPGWDEQLQEQQAGPDLLPAGTEPNSAHSTIRPMPMLPLHKIPEVSEVDGLPSPNQPRPSAPPCVTLVMDGAKDKAVLGGGYSPEQAPDLASQAPREKLKVPAWKLGSEADSETPRSLQWRDGAACGPDSTLKSAMLEADPSYLMQQWREGDNLQSWLARQVHSVYPKDETRGSDPQSPQPVVAFRGLRVRMGLHAGLTDPHSWSVNQATGRWCASGSFLAASKAIGDAGAGGMAVLSRDFWNALQLFGPPSGCLVLHMGEHQLKEQEGSAPLYLALPSPLVSRLVVLPSLRTLGLTSPTLQRAPMAQAVIVFMNAVGVKSLHAWNAEITQDTLHIYHETVSRALLEWGGYLMELVDGLCLASFTNPAAAVSWALSAQAELLTQAWDPRVLRHELCEEVAIVIPGRHAANQFPAPDGGAEPFPTPSASSVNTDRRSPLGNTGRVLELDGPALGDGAKSAPLPAVDGVAAGLYGNNNNTQGARKKVLLRGLRIKVGIDLGDVHCRINPSTGRMAYMGKVMNRTARIAGQATSSQVLCSMHVWAARNSAMTATPLNGMLTPAHPPVLGTSLGPHTLKGISEKVHIVHCTLEDSLQAS